MFEIESWKQNNSQNGADETPEACATCSAGMTPCDSGDKCIFDQQICDGHVHCPGGQDEEHMVTSDNVNISCGIPGQMCRIYHSRRPRLVKLTSLTL